MKKLIPIILLSIAFASCKHEAEHCWDCSITYSGNMADSTADSTLCNLTQSDIELRQDIKFDASGTGYKSWLLSNCERQ